MSEERKKPKGMLLLLRWQKNFNALPDAAAGRLIKAMFEYETKGGKINFHEPVLDFFWNEIQEWLDENRLHWADVVEKRSAAGKISAAKKKATSVIKSQQVLTKGKGIGKGKVKGKGKEILKNGKKINNPNGLYVNPTDDLPQKDEDIPGYLNTFFDESKQE